MEVEGALFESVVVWLLMQKRSLKRWRIGDKGVDGLDFWLELVGGISP